MLLHTSLTFFGTWWSWLLSVAAPECHHQDTRLPVGNSNYCAMNAPYAYLVEFFCSLPYEQNRKTGRSFLSHTRIHHHNLSEIRVSGECCDVWHRTVTFKLSLLVHSVRSALSRTAPMAVSVWSGSQQCRLAGRPWCRPSGGHYLWAALYSLCSWVCVVLHCQLCKNVQHFRCTLPMCTPLHCLVQLTVHFCCTVHCAKCTTLHTCTSTALHCLALQHVYFKFCTPLHCTVQHFNLCAVLSNCCPAVHCSAVSSAEILLPAVGQ